MVAMTRAVLAPLGTLGPPDWWGPPLETMGRGTRRVPLTSDYESEWAS